MKHLMPQLRYSEEGLAPAMSAETIQYHYGKHLQTYVNNLNQLIPGTPYENSSLEEIICKAEGPIFNNAAQVWNHTFFFNQFTPQGVAMSDRLAKKLSEDFGSVEEFMEKMTAAAVGLFGSGWAWLVMDEQGKFSICQKSNAGNPLREGLRPLLTVDVWEHAYYIDYRNARPPYLKAFWTLVDWQEIEKRWLDK